MNWLLHELVLMAHNKKIKFWRIVENVNDGGNYLCHQCFDFQRDK